MSVLPVDVGGRVEASSNSFAPDEEAERRTAQHISHDSEFYQCMNANEDNESGARNQGFTRLEESRPSKPWWDWLLGDARREYHASISAGRQKPRSAAASFFGHGETWRSGGYFGVANSEQGQGPNSRDFAYEGEEDEDLWVAQNNLDDFFTRVYSYFVEGGFACIITKGIVNVVTLGFTVVFSTFLLGFVDWAKLMTCKDETTCFAFGEYVTTLGSHSSWVFRAFVVLYCVLFSLYWTWSVTSFLSSIKRHWEIRCFYVRRLGVTTRLLQTMDWSEVVDRMIQVQERGEYPIQINGSSFTAKDVIMRIMRRENYMIAMMSESVLPVGTSLYARDSWFLGKNLELMLDLTILEPLFDEQHNLRRHDLNPKALQRRFKFFGSLCLLLVPFSIGFMFIYSFLKYAEEFHSKRNYLGPRTWSPFALWKFREFNEVKHLFSRRTVASMKHADLYIRQFPTPLPTVVAGGVSFIVGAFVAVLMLFTLMDESILLHITLGGRDLVWYIAIFSGVLAISRSLVPPAEELVFNPDKAMRRVVAYTHFLPDAWRSRTHTYDVRDNFSDYFQYKAVLLLRELLGILTTPYILLVVLPPRAQLISEFIQARTVSVDGIGELCIYSLMDLSAHGDRRYGSEGNRVDTDLGRFVRVDGHSAVRADGKLEKSWLNFRLSYPNWQDDQAVDPSLDDRLAAFQREMVSTSLMRSQKFGDEEDTSHFASPHQAAGFESFNRRSPSSSSVLDSSQELHDQRHRLSMSGSFAATTAAIDLDRKRRERLHSRNQGNDSVHSRAYKPLYTAASTTRQLGETADHDYFGASEMAILPLDTFRYPSAENYFYWLEEYRDNLEEPQPPLPATSMPPEVHAQPNTERAQAGTAVEMTQSSSVSNK